MNEFRVGTRIFPRSEYARGASRAEKSSLALWASLDAHEAGRRPYPAVEHAFRDVIAAALIRPLQPKDGSCV